MNLKRHLALPPPLIWTQQPITAPGLYLLRRRPPVPAAVWEYEALLVAPAIFPPEALGVFLCGSEELWPLPVPVDAALECWWCGPLDVAALVRELPAGAL